VQGGGLTPLPAVVLGVNDADVEMVDRLCVNHPIGTFEEPIRFRGGLDAVADRRVYVSATKYDNPMFGHFCDARKDDPCWRTYTIDSGHDIMLDSPQRLREVVAEVADPFPAPA
jgi:hypothetical protein